MKFCCLGISVLFASACFDDDQQEEKQAVQEEEEESVCDEFCSLCDEGGECVTECEDSSCRLVLVI